MTRPIGSFISHPLSHNITYKLYYIQFVSALEDLISFIKTRENIFAMLEHEKLHFFVINSGVKCELKSLFCFVFDLSVICRSSL